MNILIIDDDVFLQKALSFSMLEQGHTVTIANNGKEALELLENHRDAEVIVCDVMMPLLTGPSLITLLKKYFPVKLPVIIVISGVKDGPEFLKRIDVKYDHFFKKPIDYTKFNEVMRGIEASKH